MFDDIMAQSQKVVTDRSCSFEQQTFLIFDSTSNDTNRKHPHHSVIKKILLLERSDTHWQFYIGKSFAKLDHCSVPTILVPHIIKSLRSSDQKFKFQFVSNECVTFQSRMFSLFYQRLSDDDLDQSIRQHSKVFADSLYTSGNKAKSSRGSVINVGTGLQSASAHSQYLARHCMLPQSKPIPNFKVEENSLTPNQRISYLKLHLHCLKFSKELFDMAPYAVTEPTTAYGKERILLRQSFADFLDPHGLSFLQESIDPSNMAESFTGRENDFVLCHKDSKNCRELDVTISLSMLFDPNEISSNPNDEDSDIIKRFNPSSTNGKISLNFLSYSRDAVHCHSQWKSIQHSYLNDPKSCKLAKMCTKVLQLCDYEVDYQGFLWESEDAFNDKASVLARSRQHKLTKADSFNKIDWFGPETKHLKLPAAFNKMGYYSSFLHIFHSFHAHGFIVTKVDVVDFCIYFGLMSNGTSALARTWLQLLEDKTLSKDRINRLGLFKTMVGTEMKQRRDHHLLLFPADKTFKASKKIGCCKSPRYQFDSSYIHIKNCLDDIRAMIVELSSNPTVTKKSGTASTSTIAYELIITKIQSIHSIGHIKSHQFLHAACLTGLFPLALLKVFQTGACTFGPSQIIDTFYPRKGTNLKRDDILKNVSQQLNGIGYAKLSPFFLENMLCEVNRIAKSKRPESFKNYLCSEKLVEAVKTTTLKKHPDVYYYDNEINMYQHLFNVIGDKLYVRNSLFKNDSGHTSRQEIKYVYNDSEGAQSKLTIKYCGKGQRTSHNMFLKY